MSHSFSIITSPVNIITDVAYVLGLTSTDLGVLCTSDSINMWSKKKPVDWHNSLDQKTRLCPQATRLTTWFMGYDGDYGIKPAKFTSSNFLYNAIDSEMNGWRYVKDSSTYRIADFIDYDHYAKNPFSFLSVEMEKYLIPQGGTAKVIYSYNRNSIDTDHELSLYDLEYGDSMTPSTAYVVFLFYKLNSVSYVLDDWTSSSVTLSSIMSSGITYESEFQVSSNESEYKMIMCLGDTPRNGSTTQDIGKVVTIPQTNFISFKVKTY